jgi:hypothetical protein
MGNIESHGFPPSQASLTTPEESGTGPRSLRELIDKVSGRGFRGQYPAEDRKI